MHIEMQQKIDIAKLFKLNTNNEANISMQIIWFKSYLD